MQISWVSHVLAKQFFYNKNPRVLVVGWVKMSFKINTLVIWSLGKIVFIKNMRALVVG